MAVITYPTARSKFEPFQARVELGPHDGISPKLSIPLMIYQYPVPMQSVRKMDTATFTMPLQNSAPGGLAGGQESALDFSDHNNPGHVLKRSYSTPTVGGGPTTSSSEQQSSAASGGEKKRNKLGYHRTSIACTHCRRRKIRCIASPDVQNRCMNCIRLKKECSFYPVDQQPTPDKMLPSQTSGGSNVPTASSSPAVPNSSPVDLATSHQQPYPGMPIVPVPSMGTPTIQTPTTEYFPPDEKVPSNRGTPGLPFTMGEQPRTNWLATEANGLTIPKTTDPNTAWQHYPPNPTIVGQFPPYSHASTVSTAWGSSEPESGDAMGWDNMQPPVRSISFSGELPGTQQLPQYYPVAQHHRQPENFAGVYGVPMAGMDPHNEQPLDQAGILPAAVVPSQNPAAWQHQMMLQHPPQPMQYPKPEDYGGWGYEEGGRSHHI